MGHLIKSAVKRRPRVCINTWAFRGYFLVDLLFDFYLVHKLFNTVVSHCKAEPIHAEEKSRQKKSQKKGTKNSREKKIVKTVTQKKGMWKQSRKKGTVKKVAKKKTVHSYKKARAPTGFAMCPSFLLPFNFSSSACTNRLYKQVLQCAFAHSWNLLWSSRFEYYLNMNYGECAFQRTVVLLEKRRNAVPVNAEMSRFVNARRVMNTAFTKNHTASPIGDVLWSTFPSLAGKYLSGCVVALSLLWQG